MPDATVSRRDVRAAVCGAGRCDRGRSGPPRAAHRICCAKITRSTTERGAAAIVRMRGWVLLAMARAGVSDAALVFVLEELDTGIDPYLVAAAARALRS